MKKFGTPIGAAPGSANANAELPALGPPLPAPFLPGFLPFDVEVLLVVVVVVCDPPLPLLPWPPPVVCVCELPGCWWGRPVCRGGVCVWLLVVVVDVELEEVEVEVEDEDDEDDEDDEPLPLPVVVVVGGGAQDSELEATGPGIFRLEIGVPAGTPGKVSTCPVMSFTVIVQVSACATGITARA